MRPPTTASRSVSVNGLKRYLYASTTGRAAASAAAATAAVCAGSSPSGFSHSTGLPARRACTVSSACVVCTVPM